MRKTFISLLTAGLAFTMITSSQNIIYSEETTATVTFNSGVLSLDTITSDIIFQTGEVLPGEQTLPATDGFSTTISDLTGSGDGWNLNATMSNFTTVSSTDPDSSTLPNASITFNSVLPTQVEGETVPAPEVIGGEIFQNELPINIIEAEENAIITNAEGRGTWEANWEGSNVELFVPAAVATTENHTATITWELVSGIQ